ncbi:hypothetical protein [Mucilaginibacter sp.]
MIGFLDSVNNTPKSQLFVNQFVLFVLGFVYCRGMAIGVAVYQKLIFSK